MPENWIIRVRSYCSKKTFFYWLIPICLLLSVLALLTAVLTAPGLSSKSDNPENNRTVTAPDVEIMVNGFDYNSYIDAKSTISIKASKFIRRGKKILAFRSNVVKDNIFEDITGRLVSDKSEVIFSSRRAEGNMDATGSLLLADNVLLHINGKRIPVRRFAQLNFNSKTIEVDDKKICNY